MDNSVSQPPLRENVNYAPSVWAFVLFPAVAMLLGWGLRGYIGGGPFAAMIPGCFLALSLCLLLRLDPETSVMTALFGAIAIGYGGEMTYGQTLGLACAPETMAWGMLGVTVKGAVWGLFGGAVLGAGLTFHQYEKRNLVRAVALTVLFFFIGWKLVNEPRLIYFSDPINKPREESWAGLLFAAIAFLAYLHGKGKEAQAGIPLRFALWGLVGGGLGFGGGTLFLVYGPSLPVPQEWFGWWKAMEFFFGLLLGGTFGLCTWRYRERLHRETRDIQSFADTILPSIGLAVLVVVFFLVFPFLEEQLTAVGSNDMLVVLGRNLLRPLYTFVFFGAVCIALGLRSQLAAWQAAITITFFHTVLDMNRNLDQYSGFEVSLIVQAIVLVFATVAVAVFVWRMQHRKNVVPRFYLLLLWLCYGMSCIKTFVRKEYLFPPESMGNGLAVLLENHPGILPIHAIFTVSALITTWYIWRLTPKAESGK